MRELIKWFDRYTKVTACDRCGKWNPPVTKAGNQRVTLCCVEKGGFYGVPEAPKGYGSNGKTISKFWQFPIKFKWVGFLSYGARR